MSNVLSCPECKATSSSDAEIKNCPACGAPAATSNASNPAQVAGGNAAEGVDSKVTPIDAGKTVSQAESSAAPTEVSAANSPAPAAPVESKTDKVLGDVAIGLDDVNAVASLIAKEFAGTPVAGIFALLGPAAGIGAAVLHAHLTNKGFDLSQLKPIDTL